MVKGGQSEHNEPQDFLTRWVLGYPKITYETVGTGGIPVGARAQPRPQCLESGLTHTILRVQVHCLPVLGDKWLRWTVSRQRVAASSPHDEGRMSRVLPSS